MWIRYLLASLLLGGSLVAQPSAPAAPPVPAVPRCSSAIVNRRCAIELDRDNPVTPLPVRAYVGSQVLVRVTKRPLERILAESEFKATELPDAFSAIFGALSPLAKGARLLQDLMGGAAPSPPPPEEDPCKPRYECAAGLGGLCDDFEYIYRTQCAIANRLEKSFQPKLDAVAKTLRDLRGRKTSSWQGSTAPVDLKAAAARLVNDIEATPALLDRCESSEVLPAALCPLPSSTAAGNALKGALMRYEKERSSLTPALRKNAEAVIALLESRARTIDTDLKAWGETQTALALALPILVGSAATDPKFIFQDEFAYSASDATGRTATIKLSAEDMFTKTKTPIGTVVIHWGATHWEASVGTLISGFADRSFSIVNTLPAGGNTVRETNTRPTIIPMAFGHYRLAEAPALRGHRAAFLLTGGVGVNPYSTQVDFATGVTIGLRSVNFSPLVHFTRDLRLIGGFEAGKPSGSATSLPTERFWTRKFGVAISIRTPIN